LSARSRLRTYLVRLSSHGPRAIVALGTLAVCLLLTAGLGPFTPLTVDRAEHALARGDLTAAIAHCERAARWGLLPRWRALAHYRLATLHARYDGKPGMAVAELRAVLREDAGDPGLEGLALQLLAEVHEAQGNHRRAAERYEQLARGAPQPAPWLHAAALAWERAGRPDRALLRQAAVPLHDPDQSAQARLAMGRISLGVGRADKAYACYAAARDEASSDEQTRLARLGMAMALDAMGQSEQALAELDEAEPDHDLAIGIARDRVHRRAAETLSTP
jgi:tetratricopeptide (TPR) repeat protein